MLLLTFALLCLGGLVALVSVVWTAALAFQRHMAWGLAVLLVPGGGSLAFSCANWREARVPFLLGLLSVLFMSGAFSAVPPETFTSPLRSAFATVQEDQLMQQGIDELDMVAQRERGELEMRLATIKRREDALNDRRASLSPTDQAGAEALSDEIRRYNDELRPLLAELKSRDQ